MLWICFFFLASAHIARSIVRFECFVYVLKWLNQLMPFLDISTTKFKVLPFAFRILISIESAGQAFKLSFARLWVYLRLCSVCTSLLVCVVAQCFGICCFFCYCKSVGAQRIEPKTIQFYCKKKIILSKKAPKY